MAVIENGLMEKVPDISQDLPIEISNNISRTRKFFKENHYILFAIVSLYLTGIYWGKKWMGKREAFKLHVPLFLWNLILALFSISATLTLFPETRQILKEKNGLHLLMCSWEQHNYATSFWALMFFLSKFVELGDTVFVILRKQKLIFLHWFHHVDALMLCWFGSESYPAVCCLIFSNTFVHSFTYSYYALRALQLKFPKYVSKAVRILQISQFLLGVCIYWGYYFIFCYLRV